MTSKMSRIKPTKFASQDATCPFSKVLNLSSD